MLARRSSVAFVSLFAASTSACVHIGTQTGPVTTTDEAPKVTARAAEAHPQPPRMDFASLPKAPGTVVQKSPTAPSPKSATPGGVAQNPTNPAPKPVPPVEPATGATGATEPGLFPPVYVSPQPEAPLLAAVRAYTEGRPERAIEIIRTLDKQNQDLVLALLPILARGASADLNNDPATAAALVEQLHATANRLEPRAALRIEKVVFCKEVTGFGRFTPWPDNHPYRPNAQAQLYLEVRNLGSQVTNDGFMTQVHATVEVRDAYGKLVEQIDPEDYRRRVPVVKFPKELKSLSPLHDFHVLYVFSVPPAPGVYTIAVELRDPASRRTVKTQPIRFDVAGP